MVNSKVLKLTQFFFFFFENSFFNIGRLNSYYQVLSYKKYKYKKLKHTENLIIKNQQIKRACSFWTYNNLDQNSKESILWAEDSIV